MKRKRKRKKIKVYNIFLIIMSSSHYLPLPFESDRQPLKGIFESKSKLEKATEIIDWLKDNNERSK